MFQRNIDPVRRRNSLLILAGIFSVIAIIDRPSMLLFFVSVREFISLILVAFAAFMATMGIYHYAAHIFGRTELPWYTKPGGMVFLAVMLICINAAFMLMSRLLSRILGTAFLEHNAHVYLFMAFELLWIVLLEWVSYEK